jgi:Uma2 family endonuclease
MRAQPQPLLSAQDLEQIPDDGFRYELLAGELRKMPPAGHRHGRDSFSAVAGKALDWLAAGARAVVLVDPQRRTAALYRSRADIRILGPSDALEVPDVVPGWSLRVGELFEEPA